LASDARDFLLTKPFGALSISIESPLTGPFRIESPGGAARAVDANLEFEARMIEKRLANSH
jgi:hypothetical protein